jgi:hypothetical protein
MYIAFRYLSETGTVLKLLHNCGTKSKLVQSSVVSLTLSETALN